MSSDLEAETEDGTMVNENAEPSPLSPEQRTELIRRLREMDENPDSAIPWEIVRERLWKRVRGNH